MNVSPNNDNDKLMYVEFHIKFTKGIVDPAFLEKEFLRRTNLEIYIDTDKGHIFHKNDIVCDFDEWEDDLCLVQGHLGIGYLMGSFIRLCMIYGGSIEFEYLLPPWSLLPFDEAKNSAGFALFGKGFIKFRANVEFINIDDNIDSLNKIIKHHDLWGLTEGSNDVISLLFWESGIETGNFYLILMYMIEGFKKPDISGESVIKLFYKDNDDLRNDIGYLKNIKILPLLEI